MKPFSFAHVADIHLGYEQYNLAARREDFDRAFQEVIEKIIELKPNFVIVAGDLFHHARPSNATLEVAIKNFRLLMEAGIQTLAVEGSHDAAPNLITGTILNPLDSAGLIYYLPRHEYASWETEDVYVYGVPNYRTRERTEKGLQEFYGQKKPNPREDKFNIFAFHMALDIPEILGGRPRSIAEASPNIIPEGFDYYAGGHLHTPWQFPFKGALLVYSGSTETVTYEEAEVKKGFYHVKVSGKNDFEIERIPLETPRRFKVLEKDYTGLTPQQIVEKVVELIREIDEDGAVIVPVIKGTLAAETTKRELDLTRIRNAAEKALIVHPVVAVGERGLPEETIRSIFEGEMRDLKNKAIAYFTEYFAQRRGAQEAERYAHIAVDLIQHLLKGDEEAVRRILEEAAE
ncbi:MAG: DNA repair exonuclease [Nitrososphaerota archaeon]|nr:DNA repair exonuclease [Candidatus Bathyarchaeota archaeon]MDW8049092.1 DNA repair exonuclease [Nitrososphaerota archaeon]